MPNSDSTPNDTTEVYNLDLDGEETADPEAVFREAVEAVEAQQTARDTDNSESSEVDTVAPIAAEPVVLEGDEASDLPDDGDGSENELTQARMEIAELRETYLRTLADFENFRKRNERDREELRRYALMDSLQHFLPIMDNLERAVASQGTLEDLKLGVEMILRQMEELLNRFGGQEIDALGQEFDPSFHEAMSREEDSSVAQPTVVEVLERGYRLYNRLLRPARVRVAVPPESDAPKEELEASENGDPSA